MNTCEAIAERIRNLCRERNWTPNHLSYVAAVPQATIKSILNGESKNPGDQQENQQHQQRGSAVVFHNQISIGKVLYPEYSALFMKKPEKAA